ncbi:MAG TPA: AmmeMemoRadiSam system protein B, partial [Planctomycetota bacterium]|nr:AmmeMemoRadiSam system protein B [Planctomycetota bacterium]
FAREHSGEVQLPFLQMARPDVRIAPISVNAWEGRGSGREDLARFGATLASVVRDELVVATTDLTHCGEGYGVSPPDGKRPIEWAREQDRHVLDALKTLDEPAFWKAVVDRGVTMCGVGPTAAMIAFARARGATSAEIVAYGTSADREPNEDRAVGYVGVIIK